MVWQEPASPILLTPSPRICTRPLKGGWSYDDPVRRAAPTGVAAFNINGQTLHGMLRLPVRTAFTEDLPNSVLIRLQTTFRACPFLLVDEKSMLGLRQLYWIDRRIRQIFPRRANEPFGGVNVVLIGDFFQLPPVGERSLYDTKPPSNGPGQEYISAGQQLYLLFDRTIILDRVMRQQGEDERSVRFRDLLTGLREGIILPMAPSCCRRVLGRSLVSLKEVGLTVHYGHLHEEASGSIQHQPIGDKRPAYY